MWRAIRYGLSGELIDLERGEVAAGACADRAAARVGGSGRRRDRRGRVAPRARANAAERQIARFAEGSGLAEIYGDLVVRPSRVA